MAAPQRVLFIGDSLTYYNDLDKQVKAMADAAGCQNVIVDREVQGGAPLKTLWHQTSARKKIASGVYDTVVLQEDLPETKIATFHEYGKRFHELIKASGAVTVFLMTWPYKRLGWITFEGIAEAHRQLFDKMSGGITIVPASVAWQRALAERPGAKLYDDDMEHPSYDGTYLTACVTLATLWGRSPVGLKSVADAALLEKQIVFLQKIAWDTVQSWRCTHEVPNRRDALVKELFASLDIDNDGMLSASEMLIFEKFVGFKGDLVPWEEEYESLCAEVHSPGGISYEGFRHLLDNDTQRAVFSTQCTTEEIKQCLDEVRSSSSAEASVKVAETRRGKPTKVVIVPGNGGGSVLNSNWYGWLACALREIGVTVGLKDMPDPVYARESKWLPFIIDRLAGGQSELEDTIIVGHSSGAAAAMRLAEKQRLGGVVLVAAYTSDLGDNTERKSGYFSRPWNWQQQLDNCGFIIQFASTDDPFLPISEQRAVRDGLAPKIEYLEFDGRSHFFDYPFWELLEVLKQRLA